MRGRGILPLGEQMGEGATQMSGMGSVEQLESTEAVRGSIVWVKGLAGFLRLLGLGVVMGG